MRMLGGSENSGTRPRPQDAKKQWWKVNELTKVAHSVAKLLLRCHDLIYNLMRCEVACKAALASRTKCAPHGAAYLHPQGQPVGACKVDQNESPCAQT